MVNQVPADFQSKPSQLKDHPDYACDSYILIPANTSLQNEVA